MNEIAIPVSKIRRPRPTPKGRRVDPAARAEVTAALEGAPLGSRVPHREPAPRAGSLRASVGRAPCRARRGDEARHGRGLRGRDLLPSLRRREGRRRGAREAHGARVRDAFLQDGGRAAAARQASVAARARRARDRRALHRPLRGGARGVRRQECVRPREREWRRAIREARRGRSHRALEPIDYAEYRAKGGYKIVGRMRRRQARRRCRDQDDGRLGPARPGRRRIPGGPQVEDRARRDRRRASWR